MAKECKCWNASDLIPLCERCRLIGIDFHGEYAVGVRFGELLQYRCELSAGSAPGCPEIDQDREFVTGYERVKGAVVENDGNTWK
jgi:hypothetical protein